MMTERELRRNYPDTLTLENVRQILHISKRKCAWMLQNGVIKCEISEKKTKQYKIKIDDLIEYLGKVKSGEPSVAVPVGLFNAKKPTEKKPRNKSIATPTRPKKPTMAFRVWLTDKWSNESEMLLTSDISRLTGYTQQTVQRWIKEERLRAAWTKDKLVVAKDWLIDFYCDEAYKVIRKSKKHIELMDSFYARNMK